MTKSKTTFLILAQLALLLGAVSSARADGVTYDVSVDTSSITGTAGSLDFQFNSGPTMTQFATLQILNFATDGTLDPGGPSLIGDVSGTLPATLSFDNGGGFDDYFTGFTFGSTLSFQVNLSGPAVTSPDGVSTSDSTFGFSMFSDPGGLIPALTTDPNGFAFTTDIDLDGSTTPTNNSTQLTATPVVTVLTPEPTSILLFASGLAAMGLSRRRATTKI
jgi:PEP-CTERM motif